MIVEHRVYTLTGNSTVGPWLTMYGEAVPQAYERAGIKLLMVTQAVIGVSNQVITMLGYDSLAHREQSRVAFEADAGFQQFMKDSAGMVQSVQNSLLRTTDFSPLN